MTDLVTQSTALMGQLKAGDLQSIELALVLDEHERNQSARYHMLMTAHQQLVVMAYAAGFKVSQYYRTDGTYVTGIWRGERSARRDTSGYTDTLVDHASGQKTLRAGDTTPDDPDGD